MILYFIGTLEKRGTQVQYSTKKTKGMQLKSTLTYLIDIKGLTLSIYKKELMMKSKY